MNLSLRITSLVFLILLFISASLSAQEGVHMCGFDDESAHESTDFQDSKGKYYWQNTIAPALAQSKVQSDADAIHIPVVVHVVHEGEAYGVGRNIEFKQIESQIDELNKAMMGWDNNENIVPERWLDLVDYPKLKFFLADTDPNGLPTNGVTRDSMHVVNPQTGNMNTSAIKAALNWNTNNYLNIYVLSIQGTSEAGGLVGFSSFPSSVGTQGDGFVVDYRWFGGPGYAQVDFKTTIHEAGHYLGLYHTFAGNSCSLDDGIADTPNMGTNTNDVSTFTCLDGFPVGPTTCTEEHQYPNHMDYTHRSCRTMFTPDQSAVMRSVVDGTSAVYDWPSREGLVNHFGTAVHLNTNDAGICRLVYPQDIYCGQDTISPIVEIKNYGTQNLNHLWIKISNDQGLIDSTEWVGDLCLAQKTMVQLTPVNIPQGNTEWTFEDQYFDGTADEKLSNNTIIASTFRPETFDLPALENFETSSNTGLFGDQLNTNTTPGQTWEYNSLASANGQGSQSIYFQNQLSLDTNVKDTLFSQTLDLANESAAHLCFKTAYRSDELLGQFFGDSLSILIGYGCESFVYEEIWKVGGQNLTSATLDNTSTPFIPTANEWQQWSIDLSEYVGSQSISIAFVNASAQLETIYLDDIKIKASDNCSTQLDGAIDIISPSTYGCRNEYTDVIIDLKNEGTTELTSMQFELYIDNMLIGQQTWNGTLASNESTPVYLPSFITPNSNYELSILASAPNQSTDENLANNQITLDIIDTNAQPALLQEDFETIDNHQLTPLNPSIFGGWLSNSFVSAYGMGSRCVSVEEISNEHWLISENFDYSTIENATLTFDYAHAYPGDGTPLDSLLVLASTDCGASYEHLLFQKSSAQLSTYSNPNQIPATTNWQTSLIDLSAFDHIEHLRLAFVYKAKSGNAFYLDNVNLNTNCSLTISQTVTAPSCPSNCDGIIDIEIIGNIGDISYDYASFPNQSPTNLCAGSYPITITDEANCAWIDTIVLDAPSELTIEVLPTGYNCETQETIFILDANGNYTYEWADFSETPTQLATGTYLVTISDNQGCNNATSISIEPVAPLSITTSLTHESSLGAADGYIDLDVTGGMGDYTFEWNFGVGNNMAGPLSTGTYTVTITDSNGCDITESFEINPFNCNYFQSNLATEDVQCFGAQTGAISFINQGGILPISYEWSNQTNGESIQNLSAGLYEVTATDANDCPTVLTTIITQPTALTIELSSTPESSFGQQDGTASVIAMGGTPNTNGTYQYSWNNNEATAQITNLSPAVYEVTVMDNNGCTTVDAIAVNSFECMLDVAYTVTNTNCNEDNNGQISIEADAFAQPLDIEWSIPGNELIQNNLSTGNYTVTIVDGSNCTWVESFDIVVDDMEAPFIMASDITLSLDANGEAILNPDLVAIGSFDNCQLNSITASQTIFNCSHIGENELILTGIDGNNNSASDNFIVTIIDELAPSLECPESITIENCNGLITYDLPLAQDNCSTPALQLMNGAANGDLLATGTYATTFQATDATGNNQTCTFDIIVTRDNITLDTIIQPESCDGASDGALFINAIDGPHAPYAFATELLDLSAGLTTLNISGSNGCVVDWPIEIPQTPAITLEILAITSTTNGNDNGAIQTNTTGGTMPYVYEWFLDGESITFDANPVAISSGTYICQITDANDCVYTSEPIVVDNINSTKNTLATQFNIYPNPTSDFLFIQVDNELIELSNLRLFNALGQQITINGQLIDHTMLQLDLSQATKGAYFLELNLEGEVSFYQFVKL